MTTRRTRRATAVACALLALAAARALASDGVLEINQACATSPSAGCFPGDSPGFPVTITKPGSYRLTSDLDVASGDQTAIDSRATETVTIDLGGFRVQGVTICSGLPTSTCSSPGGGIGIAGSWGTIVKNGYVGRMGADGINLGFSSRVEGVSVYSNGRDGIVTEQSHVERSTVFSNGASGIHVGQRSIVVDSTSTGNREFGAWCSQTHSSVLLSGNTLEYNGLNGVFLFGGDSVQRNIISNNNLRDDPAAEGLGIRGSIRASVSENVVIGNHVLDLNSASSAGNNVCTSGNC